MVQACGYCNTNNRNSPKPYIRRLTNRHKRIRKQRNACTLNRHNRHKRHNGPSEKLHGITT